MFLRRVSLLLILLIQNIALASPRVVTLAPSLAEIVADLLQNNLSSLVGVSEFTDYKSELKKIPQVGSFVRLNLEKILSLKPDLIIATRDGNISDQIQKLQELKLKILVVEAGSLDQIKNSMTLIGNALGVPDQAKKMVHEWEKTIELIKKNASNRKLNFRVMLQVGSDPLVVAGGKSYLNEVVQLLGSKNIYHEISQNYIRPNIEDVFRHDPDQILVFSMDKTPLRARKEIQKWYGFSRLKATKLRQVKLILQDDLLRPSMRVLKGMRQLEALLYGKS